MKIFFPVCAFAFICGLFVVSSVNAELLNSEAPLLDLECGGNPINFFSNNRNYPGQGKTKSEADTSALKACRANLGTVESAAKRYFESLPCPERCDSIKLVDLDYSSSCFLDESGITCDNSSQGERDMRRICTKVIGPYLPIRIDACMNYICSQTESPWFSSSVHHFTVTGKIHCLGN